MPSTSPRGAYILEGRFNGAVFALPDWVAYIWRVLFSEFTVFTEHDVTSLTYIDRVASTAMMMMKIAKTTTMVIKRSQGRKWLYKNKRLEGEYKNRLLV